MPESTEIATRTPQQELIARVRGADFTEQVALALPENISAKRFIRATVTALLQNPDIVKAETDSIFNGLLRAAQDGLVPDGREAALVMYGTKAQYLPMIGGFRKIAAEYGWAIRAQVVYENDLFEHQVGLEEALTHRPVRPGDPRGGMVAVYAVATHRDGRKQFAVMYAEDVEKVKKASKASGRGPWVDWPERMWEKTVGRRLFKELPLDPADQRIASVIAADEPGAAAELLYGPRAVIEHPPAAAPADAARTIGGDTVDNGGRSEEPLSPGPAAATDFSDEPGSETAPEETAPEEAVEVEAFDEDEVTAASLVTVPNGVNKGLTLEQVAAKGADGEAWLLWALRKWAADSFRAAVELYVQARLDVVWAKYTEAKEQS